MKTESIEEIRIDESGRLILKPSGQDFRLIYCAAMEVHLDPVWNELRKNHIPLCRTPPDDEPKSADGSGS